MIIPDNLQPLPVLQTPPEREKAPESEEEEFVSEATVRQLLVGPMKITPLGTSQVPDGDAFAGRDDLDEGKPFIALDPPASKEAEPAKVFAPHGPHPALSKPRCAAPPSTRIEIDPRMKRRRFADHWWVLGMGAAMLAVVASGALIELVSRSGTAGPGTEPPSAERSTGEDPMGDTSLAASNPEYPAP